MQDEFVASANPGKVAAQATSLLYAGEQFDTNVQMYYNRARYYDQNTGRFNRTDPFAGRNRDPQSLHKYLYCHNNPVNRIDPSGEFAGLADVSVTMGIKATLSVVQILIWFVALRTLWKVFGPKGRLPTVEEQKKIDASRNIISTDLVGKTFNLYSGVEITITQKYSDYNKYYVADLGEAIGEHRPFPFESRL